tara:strand:+ start:179 stop:592 length:414 start_codon:yes stop_codon:yes gene_type:complete
MLFDDGNSKVGLGDAILRLINVRYQRMRGIGSSNDQNEEETSIIIDALNQYELHISFVCEIPEFDGADEVKSTTIDIIKKSAETKVKKGVSCCRIQPKKLSEEEISAEKEQLEFDLGNLSQVKFNQKKKKRSSRRKK